MSNLENKPVGDRQPWAVIAVVGGCAILVLCLGLCVLAIGAVATYRVGDVNMGQRGPVVTSVEGEGEIPSGEQVFTSAGCSACHSLSPEVTKVGPSLAGIAQRAATMDPEMTAEMYITESILDPRAYVVEGYRSEIMPDNYAQLLSDQELKALVEFLMAK